MMIKIHIDNIDNDDGRVWAVQEGRKYHRVHGVITQGVNFDTVIARKQPRAYLRGKGKVTLTKIGRVTIAVVTNG